jgi:hypothetical protein
MHPHTSYNAIVGPRLGSPGQQCASLLKPDKLNNLVREPSMPRSAGLPTTDPPLKLKNRGQVIQLKFTLMDNS